MSLLMPSDLSLQDADFALTGIKGGFIMPQERHEQFTQDDPNNGTTITKAAPR
jgi:hypothetical protein